MNAIIICISLAMGIAIPFYGVKLLKYLGANSISLGSLFSYYITSISICLVIAGHIIIERNRKKRSSK